MINIQLFQGQFNKAEALDLITQMTQVKIKYHENKIRTSHNEEDIEMRESRIRQLQKDLHEVRRQLESKDSNLALASQIEIN